jgi:hypothetical protein
MPAQIAMTNSSTLRRSPGPTYRTDKHPDEQRDEHIESNARGKVGQAAELKAAGERNPAEGRRHNQEVAGERTRPRVGRRHASQDQGGSRERDDEHEAEADRGQRGDTLYDFTAPCRLNGDRREGEDDLRHREPWNQPRQQIDEASV